VLTGIKFKANPTPSQKLVLSQWMGCARLIWNAKVQEERYHTTFARKYCKIGTYAKIDATTKQFKSKELTPWLFECPSQIIRNSASNWFKTYHNFMKGSCGKPKQKKKSANGSIYLTRELFRFEKCTDGNLRLFIGQKKNNIGYLSFKKHSKFEIPNSLYLKRECGKYYLSFCYDNGQDEAKLLTNAEHFKVFKDSSREYLEENVVGIDRGVAIPVQAGSQSYDFSRNQKKNMAESEKTITRLQRQMTRQEPCSNRRSKTKQKIGNCHAKIANIRNDFAHKTSRDLADSQSKIIVFESLKTSNMVRKPKAKQDEKGRYIPNKAKQKSGLNKAILNVGWYKIEAYTIYKAYKAGKAVFKISAYNTSQECAKCGYTHPDNRQTQDLFVCGKCRHADNADRNASLVIAKRAINLILYTGTVLSDRNILVKGSDIGRGGNCQTSRAKSSASKLQRSVKKEKIAATAYIFEAQSFMAE